MYLAGVSVRRVEDITEALWGSKVSPGTISNLNKKAYENIDKWRNRSLENETYPYVYSDFIHDVQKESVMNYIDHARNMSVLNKKADPEHIV